MLTRLWLYSHALWTVHLHRSVITAFCSRDGAVMYFQTLTNCVSVETVPSNLEITYSDSWFSLFARDRLPGILERNISFCCRCLLIACWLPAHRQPHSHARLTTGKCTAFFIQEYAVPFKSGSLLYAIPRTNRIITKTYGGSSRMLSSKWQSVHPSKPLAVSLAFRLLRKSFLDGFSLIALLSSAFQIKKCS